MIHYKLQKNNNSESAAYGKYYARAVHELMEFDELVSHMASHHTPFSEGTIRGVLIEMLGCLRELLLEGKAVRLGDLGIFRIGLKSAGCSTVKDFNAGEHVKGVRVNLYLGKRFRAADLFKASKIREAGRYAIDDAIDEGEGDSTVDNPEGGEG